jgi:CRISPR type I-E/ECOLI-associated protein CasB/Cse2
MTATVESAVPKQRDKPRSGRRRGEFGGHVAQTITTLQAGYLKEQAAAVATVALLRAAVDREPGASYAVLDVTGVPDRHLEQGRGDEPTPRERAKHAAVTLYATHQQSVHEAPMHVDGVALGEAVHRLTRASKDGDQTARRAAVLRRFAALGTAATFAQLLHHLRSLVRQLRDEKIPLDYGLLAEDLAQFQKPGGPEHIRARWGRDFYRTDLNEQANGGTEDGEEPQP